MINEEEKFNDLLRSKLNEREFFFDELNWEKAEQAIVREEKSKKTKKVILIFLGGFILGAALMFPLASVLTSGNKQNSSASNSKPVPNNDDKTITAANNTITTPTATTANNSNSSQGPTTTTPSEATGKNTPVANNVSSGNKKPTKSKKAKPADNPDTYAYVRPASERKHKKPVENPYIDELPDNLKPKNSNANNQTSDNNNQTQQSSTNSNPQNNASENASAGANNASSVNNNTASTEVKNNSQANNTSQTQAKTDSNKLQPLAPVNTPTQNKNFISQDSKIVDVPKPKFKPTNTLSIDAGGGYSLGWKNENGKGGDGISPVIGVRLNHSFSKKISLAAGVRYCALTNINTPYSNTLVSYDFGYNSTITTVSPQMLHYAALPLELQYTFKKDNTVSLGGTLLYLLNTTSTVSNYTQNGLGSPSSEKKTVWGYTDGFNQFDAQIAMAYRRRLFGSFGAGIEAYYGLLDVENNSFFFNSFDRNSGLRLVLSYDIIK